MCHRKAMHYVPQPEPANTMWRTLLYSGFETYFGPSTQCAGSKTHLQSIFSAILKGGAMCTVLPQPTPGEVVRTCCNPHRYPFPWHRTNACTSHKKMYKNSRMSTPLLSLSLSLSLFLARALLLLLLLHTVRPRKGIQVRRSGESCTHPSMPKAPRTAQTASARER